MEWHRIVDAAQQAWPPFVLVAGLLLIGVAAAEEDVFEALGARLASDRLGPRALLVSLLALVAVVTAVLNLDTSVVFLTPVLVHAARRRGLDERPFLYGTVFMSNSASLLLPGSNLTNLLVLHGSSSRPNLLLPWLASCGLTIAFLVAAFRFRPGEPEAGLAPRLRFGVGAAAIVVAGVLVVALANAALPVLAVGLAATLWRRTVPAIGLPTLAGLFALSLALGTLARSWSGPATFLAGKGAWATAGIGAGAAVLLNNLPAAVLLSSRTPPHPGALLIGLDLGPNLAVTGSLSAFLWLRTARGIGAKPSLAVFSRLGVVLVPLTLAGALIVR